MKNKYFKKSTSKFWLLALFITLATSTSATLVTYYIKSLIKDDVINHLSLTLEASIAQYKYVLSDKKRLARFWAEDPTLIRTVTQLSHHSTITPENLKNWEGLLKSIKRSEKLLGVNVLDRNGDIMLSEELSELQFSIKNNISSQRLASIWSGEIFISQPLPAYKVFYDENIHSDKTAIILILAPIRGEDQQTHGILTFFLDPHQITIPLFNYNQFGETGQTYAISEEGLLLTHVKLTEGLSDSQLLSSDIPHPELNLHVRDPGVNITSHSSLSPIDIDHQPLTYMASQLSQKRDGFTSESYKDYRGVSVIGAWRWDKDLDMGFVSETSYDEAFSSYMAIRNAIFIGASLVILLSLIAIELNRRKNKQHITNLELRNRIIEYSANGIVVINNNNMIKLANPALYKLFGYADKELEGLDISELMPEHIRRHYTITSIMSNFKTFNQNAPLQGLRKDGSTFPLDLIVTKMKIHDENYFIGILRDISESVNHEKELLAARNKAQEALVSAESANKAKSIFLSKMNHELRTPLNAIIGFSELLELDCENEEEKELINIIHSSGQHLLSLINDILDWAFIESGRIQLDTEAVNLQQLLSDVCMTSQDKLTPLELNLDLNIAEGKEYWLEADSRRLKQAFINLINFAIQCNKQNGFIRLHVYQDNTDHISVAIQSSTSETLDMSARVALFHNLEKIEAVEGSGIGLILARDLIYLMEGEIAISTSADHEVSIIIELKHPITAH